MTKEEMIKKIAELEKEATLSTSKINKLNDENADRRAKSSLLKKQLHVAKSIVEKNNIQVDYDKIGTDNLSLDKETGKVVGDVAYNPASAVEVGGGVPPSSSGAPESMTIETIQGMGRADIAKNWGAITSVLESQQTTN